MDLSNAHLSDLSAEVDRTFVEWVKDLEKALFNKQIQSHAFAWFHTSGLEMKNDALGHLATARSGSGSFKEAFTGYAIGYAEGVIEMFTKGAPLP